MRYQYIGMMIVQKKYINNLGMSVIKITLDTNHYSHSMPHPGTVTHPTTIPTDHTLSADFFNWISLLLFKT